MRGFGIKTLFLALTLSAFAFATDVKTPTNQDIFPIEKEKLCPQDRPNCQAKSCMELCLADGEDEDSCLEECVQYARRSDRMPGLCRN